MPFPKGDLQTKNPGRWDTKERMRRQRGGCMADGTWGVPALVMSGGGKSLLPEIVISLRGGRTGASSGPTAGRSAWAHWGWRNVPETQSGTKKDAKKEGWETGASVNSNAKQLEGHTALGDFLQH